MLTPLVATTTERGNGTSATVTRDLTVNVLAGVGCATPAGLNPYVSYLADTSAVAATGAGMAVVAGPLVPVGAGAQIVVPGIMQTVIQAADPADSDESMEEWLQNLGRSLGNAFTSEVERVLRGEQ
ncbi:MAG: hypothetical protein H7Z39_10315 [Burkholderiaceae bacterium]|nr:hypothetical protein [Burkholderiaceae bacterium]